MKIRFTAVSPLSEENFFKMYKKYILLEIKENIYKKEYFLFNKNKI